MAALKLLPIIAALLAIPQAAPSTCTAPFHSVPSYPSCVLFLDQLVPWTGARDACLALGADLPSFRSEAELAAVTAAWRSRPNNQLPNFPLFWIGLHRDAGGDLKWSDGTALSYKGESIHNAQEDYFSAGYRLTLFGFRKHMQCPFICAKSM